MVCAPTWCSRAARNSPATCSPPVWTPRPAASNWTNSRRNWPRSAPTPRRPRGGSCTCKPAGRCADLAFANPLLNFERLLFVKRFTQETYPDVCLNHMPWVSRPGGDICVLSQPFSADGAGQSVRNVINGALGPGHVHGMDLWWDGDRVVFGYAKAKSDQPPAGLARPRAELPPAAHRRADPHLRDRHRRPGAAAAHLRANGATWTRPICPTATSRSSPSAAARRCSATSTTRTRRAATST